MIKAVTIVDAPVLIPNRPHRNFIENGEIINKGTEIEGEIKKVQGRRRGQDFMFTIFKTKEGKIIYLNKTNMKDRIVTLSANAEGENYESKVSIDGVSIEENKHSSEGVAPIIINAKKNNSFFKSYSFFLLLAGGVSGFLVAKNKNKPTKEVLVYSFSGALAGFVIGKVIDKQAEIKVEKK